MAGQLYFCIHRNVNTTASGSRGPPNGCISGRFDHVAQFKKVPGNCTGIFIGRPACTAFYPSDETPAGQRFWRTKKTSLEIPPALAAPSHGSGFPGTCFTVAGSRVAEVTASVFAELGIKV